MAYDYHMPWEKNSGHHAALSADARDPVTANGFYAAGSVQRYLQAGVGGGQAGAGRAVLRLRLERAARRVPTATASISRATAGATGGMGGGNSYGFSHLLKQGLITLAADGSTAGGKGYKRYWNASAKAPYLYNPAEQVWITYEDPASLKEKAGYIKAQRLRGAMFWELSADGGAPDAGCTVGRDAALMKKAGLRRLCFYLAASGASATGGLFWYMIQ